MKLYLVKLEVKANHLEEAMKNWKKGEIYEVQLAEEKSWPIEETKVAGFSKDKKML